MYNRTLEQYWFGYIDALQWVLSQEEMLFEKMPLTPFDYELLIQHNPSAEKYYRPMTEREIKDRCINIIKDSLS